MSSLCLVDLCSPQLSRLGKFKERYLFQMLERENILYFSSSTQLCTTLGAKVHTTTSSIILDFIPLRPATQKRKMTDISISL